MNLSHVWILPVYVSKDNQLFRSREAPPPPEIYRYSLGNRCGDSINVKHEFNILDMATRIGREYPTIFKTCIFECVMFVCSYLWLMLYLCYLLTLSCDVLCFTVFLMALKCFLFFIVSLFFIVNDIESDCSVCLILFDVYNISPSCSMHFCDQHRASEA